MGLQCSSLSILFVQLPSRAIAYFPSAYSLVSTCSNSNLIASASNVISGKLGWQIYPSQTVGSAQYYSLCPPLRWPLLTLQPIHPRVRQFLARMEMLLSQADCFQQEVSGRSLWQQNHLCSVLSQDCKGFGGTHYDESSKRGSSTPKAEILLTQNKAMAHTRHSTEALQLNQRC